MTNTPECANPLTSAAASLITLEGAAQKPDQRTIEQVLQMDAMHIAENDLGGMEAMLAYQTQLLHRIFTHSLVKYAGVDVPENSRIYSNIVLKAQSYCRLTTCAIIHIKKTEERTGKRDNERTLKLQNELLRKPMP